MMAEEGGIFMKTYSNRETAPLKYHSLFLYVGLPLSFISNILSTTAGFNKLTYETDLFAYVLIDTVFALILVILAGITFCGLRKWKPYSWYTIHGINLTIIIYSFILIGICFSLDLTAFSDLTEAFAKIIVSILVSIYYWKRKGLFFVSETTDAEKQKIISNESLSPVEENIKESTAEIKPFEACKYEENNFIIENFTDKKAEEPKQKKNFSKPFIIVSVLLVCSLIGNIYLFNQNQNITLGADALISYWEDAYDDIYLTCYRLADELDDRLDEYYFFHDRAVITTEQNRYYHRYTCKTLDLSYYWIHNTEYAIMQGYSPCPTCNPGETHISKLVKESLEKLIESAPKKPIGPPTF